MKYRVGAFVISIMPWKNCFEWDIELDSDQQYDAEIMLLRKMQGSSSSQARALIDALDALERTHALLRNMLAEPCEPVRVPVTLPKLKPITGEVAHLRSHDPLVRLGPGGDFTTDSMPSDLQPGRHDCVPGRGAGASA